MLQPDREPTSSERETQHVESNEEGRGNPVENAALWVENHAGGVEKSRKIVNCDRYNRPSRRCFATCDDAAEPAIRHILAKSYKLL
jgi:hypothetical protein